MNYEFDKANGYFHGRGAQVNTPNRFDRYSFAKDFPEMIDEDIIQDKQTQYIDVFPKTIINPVASADIPGKYSMNPYQGCEHGCLYCYARVTHEYWGYSAGLDFERKILVKRNAPALLEKAFQKKIGRYLLLCFLETRIVISLSNINWKLQEVCWRYV
jgi:hypothetical protein